MKGLKKKLLSIPYLDYILIKLLSKFEHGPFFSKSLREFTKEKYNVEIGMYSYGSCFEKNFNLGGKVKIGKYCSFAENVRYFAANHPIKNITTSPLYYNKSLGYDVKDVKREQLHIEDDVWIGYNTTILPSCKQIGRGSVVAANSTVTHDVPRYSIVAGNPAKLIKMRFSSQEIEMLEKSEWWELNSDQLFKYYEEMSTPLSFSEKIISDKKGKL